MYRSYIILVLLVTLSFSSEKINRTSELELFLFKIGFEALLSDVKTVKSQTNLNTKDLENVTTKLEYVFNEITKNKTTLEKNFNDNSSIEINNFKEIILGLEKRIINLETKKTINTKKLTKTHKKNKQDVKYSKAIVQADLLKAYIKPLLNSKIIKLFKKGKVLDVEYCDKFGWCKRKNKNEFFARYLVELIN